MKKKGFLVLTAIAGLTAITLAGCGKELRKYGSEEVTEGSYKGMESTEAMYGVAAVTTAKLFAASSAGAVSTACASAEGEAVPLAAGGTGMEKAQAEAEDFNKYFNMLDSFLDRGATTTSVEENPVKEGAPAGYRFKLTVTGKDVEGGDVTHIVYFTETEGPTRTDTRRDDDEVITTTLSEYTLEGVVEMGKDAGGNAVYYYMSGTRTDSVITETEGREEETEQRSTLVMTSRADRENTLDYVRLTHTQSTEAEEGESETEALYTYDVYAGGVLTESTAVGFETEEEHGETEEEYTVRFQKGASRGVYTIERETERGATEIAVEYRIDGASGKFYIVKNADGTYRYRFSDNAADDRNYFDFDD